MINFTKVRWKNLLSSGNKFTEIELNSHQTTLILGENGAGKSTLLDALCFGLYGRGFRNLKKELLINSINEKALVVEVEFYIGKKEYKIIRGAKPNIFELYVDDILVNQDATVRDYQDHLEKHILKMSYRSFTQVAILGSANFTPFMQLRAKDRRKLVEDLLDINIFTTMMQLLRKKKAAHIIEVKDTQHAVEILEERLNGLNEQVKVMTENRMTKITQFEKTVVDTNIHIGELLEVIDTNSEEIATIQLTISDKDSISKKLKDLQDMEKQLTNARKKALKEVEFYEENDECPVCKQGLDEEHKKEHLESKTKKATEIASALQQIEDGVSSASKRIIEISDIQSDIDNIQRQVGLHQTEILSNQKYIQKINGEIETLKIESDGGTDVHERITKGEDDLDVLHTKHKALIDRTHYYEIATMLLRDQGVKEKIIKQYVPIMNKLINKYLAQLEFYVGFELDESFDETIKSRFRDVFKYENFSQGEKMRIDLALLFTWRSVARMKNSVNTNLLILDEVFDSSLDVTGTDEFLKLLNTLTDGVNAFIISHKGDTLYDKFSNVLRFEKYKNFSRLAE
jgi:DNA repair exonuclease SbcCD ATPase subunit